MRLMPAWLLATSIALTFGFLPTAAAAQPAPPLEPVPTNRCERMAVAVGISVSARRGADEATIGHISPGPVLRVGRGCTGWGVQTGLGWYAADLEQPLGASIAGFGELKVRPLLGGYGYTHRFGPATVTGKVMAGFALNSFELRPAYEDGYRALRGAASVTTTVSNTFVVKPEVTSWIDMGPKVSLNLGVGYAVTRPEVTVSSSLGRDTRAIKADMLSVTVGAVYRVF